MLIPWVELAVFSWENSHLCEAEYDSDYLYSVGKIWLNSVGPFLAYLV